MRICSLADGVPDHPPADIEFEESLDDCYCNHCDFDTSDYLDDPIVARDQGVLIAIERAEGSPFSSMGGTIPTCYYWRCPEGHYFSTESELTLGGMA